MIAPHADDETLGCGGLIARAKAAGAKVHVLVVSVGDLPHYATNMNVTSGAERKKELQRVMTYLKVDGFNVLYEDTERYMKLDTLPRKELVEHFDSAMNSLKPTLVALPAPSFHQDHEAVYEAGITSCRPHLKTKKWVPPVVLVYEYPVVSWGNHPFAPNFYVDISKVLSKKLKALSLHRSQVCPAPHPLSLENVKRLAELRGSEVSVSAAEAFQCLRLVV